MKKWMLALTLASGVLALSACSSNNSDKIAESNSGNVTKDELYTKMKNQVGNQALQQLIFEKVLEGRYSVKDADVTAEFNKYKKQYGASFQTLLTQNGYKDEADFKKSLKTQLLLKKAAAKDIPVSDKELKAYYKPDIKVRHILVKDEATANQVKQKLDAGQKFEDLAKQFSTDTSTAQNGGDLGQWISFGTSGLDPEFEKAAFALKVNDISGPVKSQFGYHIIQKTAEKPLKPFNQVKDDIKSRVVAYKLSSSTDALSTIMKKEFKAANVKVNDKDLKDALNPTTTTQSQSITGQ
jgi:foldase protein PrsA